MLDTLPPENLLTLKETARLLRVSRSTMMRLLSRGELHGYKVGRTWRFRLDDLPGMRLRRTGERDGHPTL